MPFHFLRVSFFLLNLSDTEKLKYLEGSLTLSFQSIILSDYKWKGLGHSNVLFSTEETLQNADEAFDVRQRDHSHHEKQEYKIVNIWGEHMVKKLFLNINTYYISFSLFCFSRNNLLCFLNVIHIYQTAWFLTFRNFFHQTVTEALTKGTNYQGTRFFFHFFPLFEWEAGCRENVNYQLLLILL